MLQVDYNDYRESIIIMIISMILSMTAKGVFNHIDDETKMLYLTYTSGMVYPKR